MKIKRAAFLDRFRKKKPSAEAVSAARKLYADFTGHDDNEIVEVPAPKPIRAAALIGTVDALCYTTVRDGNVESYVHEFKRDARPAFAVSHDGKQLLLIGGSYRFTDRGIEDFK